MLQINRFDIKTGKPIQERIDGQDQPAIKQVEHSYLEHWLETNKIAAQFSVAKFYESVNDVDRQRLEAEDRVLVFSSGSDGYFTDAATAQLMTEGSDTVSSIYAANERSAHNVVAYGSLISSDGVASTAMKQATILVIDDEARSHGREPLFIGNKPLSEQQLSALYDKMGDGTMLVTDEVMHSLQTTEERQQITLKTSEKTGVDGDITTLAQDILKADAALAAAEQQEYALARRSVVQFRAASAKLPGIAKGTAASSKWCQRLGVDAIISTNDIKGDDGRFSQPGIQTVSDFWINRKSTAEYGLQSVGPQVKYTIPKATAAEINPKVQAEAAKLAQVAGDFVSLSQRYIEQKERKHLRIDDASEDNDRQESHPDGLYEVLKADKYGQLAGQANAVRGLNRFVRSEWKRLATNGTSVPSAMAQHHSQLKPWEVCKKDLPHGAIVALYRSPFPNVGAAAIAINNTEVIRTQDDEAFNKQGVAYLPPWTAKNIAITDFDGDANGFFVGYEPTVSDLPEQIRSELSGVGGLEKDQQYEAGRALFAKMIQQLEQKQETRITPAESPLAVKEFIEQNAPDVRPPEIIKQKKQEHTWQDGESHAAATWRAWEITADNPTGKVANAGMSLLALSEELKTGAKENQEALLHQVSAHFTSVLQKADRGQISIPDDDWLSSQNFSAFYRERIEDIAGASKQIVNHEDPQERAQVVSKHLQNASELLSEVANGPNAVNLQTAVDTAKSSKGIDEPLHQFVKALQYKEDALRENKNNPDIYMKGTLMPTSTNEPVANGVQLVNQQYSGVLLEERENVCFNAIFPEMQSEASVKKADTISKAHNQIIHKASESKSRLRQRRDVDQKPTLQVTLPDGRQLTLQNIDDTRGTLPIWRADNQPLAGTIRIKRDDRAPAREQFPAQLTFVDKDGQTKAQRIGFVSPESAKQHQLHQRLKDKKLSIADPHVTIQVPWAQQHDTDMLYEQARQYLDSSLAPPAGKDEALHHQQATAALWQSYSGRNIAMKLYPDLVSAQISFAPETVIGRLQVSSAMRQQLIEQSPHTVQISADNFEQKKGKVTKIVSLPTVNIVKPNGDRLFVGAFTKNSRALAPGKTYMAHLSKNESSDKVLDMQILELPTVEQTKAQLNALEQGRRHMTFDGEPYAVYSVREGDIVVGRPPENDRKQVAVQVGKQYRITQTALDTEGYIEKWADREKASAADLYDSISQTQGDGKTLWGLTVEPLGEYKADRIHASSGELWLAGHQDTTLENSSAISSSKPQHSLGNVTPSPNYSPSYGEVSNWFDKASEQGYPTLELEKIQGIKETLINKHWNTGDLASDNFDYEPSLDYRHPDVTISLEERAEMDRLVSTQREHGQTLSQQVASDATSPEPQQPSDRQRRDPSPAERSTITAESRTLMSVDDVAIAMKAARYIEDPIVLGELEKLLSEQPEQTNISMRAGLAKQVEQTRALARQKVQQGLAADIAPLASQLMQKAEIAGLVKQQGNISIFPGKRYIIKAIRQETGERVEVSCRKNEGFVHSVDGKVVDMQGLQKKDRDVFRYLAMQTPKQLRQMIKGKKKEVGIGV